MNLKLVLVNTGANHMTVQLTWMEMATNNSEKTYCHQSQMFYTIYLTQDGGGGPFQSYGIVGALNHIHNVEMCDTRRQAHNLLLKIEEFEFMFMLHLRTGFLGQFHKVSNTLQILVRYIQFLLQFVSST